MKVTYKLLIITIVCILNFSTNNLYLKPDIMEARNLITAREIVKEGNWLNPTMNGYPRLAKPPFPTWINAAIAKVYPVDNLAVHRIPAAIMGFLMVLAVFFIAKGISGNERTGFYAGLVAATSYYLILMSRQATWDIYCHSLMAVSIAFLVVKWSNKQCSLWHYAMAGLFMGLSFMSKGPVSFYVILIPFIISWFFIMKNVSFKEEWKGLLIMLCVFFVVGLAWPLYQITVNYELLMKVVSAESQAWTERHVRPFYQYWGFWSHVGIWSLFALATLVYPYMKSRLNLKEYKFFLFWLVIMVVLLSIPAEKKERYLLPVIIPLSCLIGYFINYLYQSWKKKNLRLADKNLIKVFISLLILISLAFPFLSYFANKEIASVITFIIFWGIAAWLVFTLKSLNIAYLVIGSVLLMTAATIFGVKDLEPITNPNYRELSDIKSSSFYEKDFYSSNINPKQIYALGKKVDTLQIKNAEFLPPLKDEFVVIEYYTINANAFKNGAFTIEPLDAVPFDKKNEKAIVYFYLARNKNSLIDSIQ